MIPDEQWFVKEGGLRLDQFLAEQVSGSRHHVQGFIARGCVRVSGHLRKSAYRLKPGEQVQLVRPSGPARERVDALPGSWILHEDEALLALNKPPNLVVHPAKGHHGHTLVEILERARPELALLEQDRFGLIHRLDKDTSGVLVIAKTAGALKHLSQQFAQRTIKKEYLAIVHGLISHQQGRVCAPIGRSQKRRGQMAVDPQGRPAETTFERLETAEKRTLLRVRPLSGRTHQVRIHLATIGFPIVGDSLYGPRQAQTSRVLLHAFRLTLSHPKDQSSLALEAPVPEDFLRAWHAAGGKFFAEREGIG